MSSATRITEWRDEGATLTPRNPRDVRLNSELIQWTAGKAITGGNYEIGRDADGTNQLHFNVPTGAGYEWSVNDIRTAVLSSTAFTSDVNLVRFQDATTSNGIDIVPSSGRDQQIRGVNTVSPSSTILFQNVTFSPGAAHNAVNITPTWVGENFVHRALAITGTQQGANNIGLAGLTIFLAKESTGRLELLTGIGVAPPTVSAGNVSQSEGIRIADMATSGGSVSYAINILSQTANSTTTRAIELAGTGSANAIRFGGTVNVYSPSAEILRFTDTTDGGGLAFTLTGSGNQLINTIDTGDNELRLQSQSFTAGADHEAVNIVPSWTSENFKHTGLRVSVSQNGANTNALNAIELDASKFTGGTDLDSLNYVLLNGPSVVGTISLVRGINISDLASSGVTSSFGIDIASQSGSGTTRAIRLQGSGSANGIEFGDSPIIYSPSAEAIRFTDSTDGGGIAFTMTAAGDQQINTIDTGDNALVFQNQTFTAGSTHSAFQITPTWATENQNHRGLDITVTQNGANSDASGFGLEGIRITTNKDATANTVIAMANLTLAAAVGATATATANSMINILAPTGGTIVNSFGIDIANQALTGGTYSTGIRIQAQTANATTTRAIDIVGSGSANAIRLGSSPNLYSNAANQLTFADSTDVDGIRFVLGTGNQSIRTVATDSTSLILQDQTFTAGATHNSVQINPTWAQEDQIHRALIISPTQNGSNTQALVGINISPTKATAATTLSLSTGLFINSVTVSAGSVTSSEGIRIADQSVAGISTPAAINIAGLGKQNAIVWGGSALQFSGAPPTSGTVSSEQISIVNSSGSVGIVFDYTTSGSVNLRAVGGGNVTFDLLCQTNNIVRVVHDANRDGIIFNVNGSGSLRGLISTTTSADLRLGAGTGVVRVTSARHQYAKGADVASAGDITLGTDGNFFDITGVTTINTISSTAWAPGSVIFLQFDGSVTLANNTAGAGARLLLSGSANFAATADDTLTLIYDGTFWRELARTVI